MANAFLEACENLNTRLRAVTSQIKETDDIQELRLRAGLPLMVTTSAGNLFLRKDGSLSRTSEDSFVCDRFDLLETFKILCEYSVHSYQNEINQGFITVRGGHRAGLCGSAVCDNGIITNVKNISSINLRIAKGVRGAADDVIRQLVKTGLESAVIVGPPSSGKTTVLRDAVRQIADGFGQTRVAVVDERGELSAVYGGSQLFDLGKSTDCLFAYPKAQGVDIAIRSLSPQVIVFDEIGTLQELRAVDDGFHAGVHILTSVHANGVTDFLSRKIGRQLLMSGAFDRFFFLEGYRNPGKISKILEREDLLCAVDRNYFADADSDWNRTEYHSAP